MRPAAPLSRTIAVALVSVTAMAVQERPLPDQESFLHEVRARLQTDASLQSSYIYVETRREQKLDSYSGSARVGLVAVLRRAGTSEFSGYRKFSVETSTTFQPPTP